MTTFYFDTGVTPHNNPHLWADQVWRKGTKHIPFTADAPEDATLLFLSNNPDLPEKDYPGIIVREVSNTSIGSKYAYFRV
jgi:hypothetical protein